MGPKQFFRLRWKKIRISILNGLKFFLKAQLSFIAKVMGQKYFLVLFSQFATWKKNHNNHLLKMFTDSEFVVWWFDPMSTLFKSLIKKRFIKDRNQTKWLKYILCSLSKFVIVELWPICRLYLESPENQFLHYGPTLTQ